MLRREGQRQLLRDGSVVALLSVNRPVGIISVDRTCETVDSINPEAIQQDAAQEDEGADEEQTVAESFVLPALVGMNLQEAQDALQDRGSYLLTQTDGTGQARFQMLDYNWKVCGRDPPPEPSPT